MRKPEIKNRQLAGQLRREQYEVNPEIRAARSLALAQFDLTKLKIAADERVDAARERLEQVDIFGLRKELEDAIKAQTEIDSRLAALQADNVLMAG